jgi:hypothetical protein
VREVASYGNGVESARQALAGLTMRYEELVSDPEHWMRATCEFLDVAWEPAMLEYGAGDHGPFEFGIGDWSDKLRSGRIQPAAPLPDSADTPAPLRDLAAAWGYLPAGRAARR